MTDQTPVPVGEPRRDRDGDTVQEMSDGTKVHKYRRFPGWEHHHKTVSGYPSDYIFKDGAQVGGDWQGLLPAIRAIDRAEDPEFAAQHGLPVGASWQELLPALEAADRAYYATPPEIEQSNRAIPAEELTALTLIEVVENGMRLAIQILGEASRGPMEKAPARIDRAITLLSHLAGETHNRELGDARRQVLPDIEAAVRHRLTEINAQVDQTLKDRDEQP